MLVHVVAVVVVVFVVFVGMRLMDSVCSLNDSSTSGPCSSFSCTRVWKKVDY